MPTRPSLPSESPGRRLKEKMAEESRLLQELALQVKLALENGESSGFGELLDPDVTWGPPGDPSPPALPPQPPTGSCLVRKGQEVPGAPPRY